MIYLYTFAAFTIAGLAAAVAFARWLGLTVTLIVGALGAVAMLVLFWLNKSDSVADTLIEKVADATPPLISGSLVIGWWIGWAIMRWWRRG